MHFNSINLTLSENNVTKEIFHSLLNLITPYPLTFLRRGTPTSFGNFWRWFFCKQGSGYIRIPPSINFLNKWQDLFSAMRCLSCVCNPEFKVRLNCQRQTNDLRRSVSMSLRLRACLNKWTRNWWFFKAGEFCFQLWWAVELLSRSVPFRGDLM